MSRSFTTTNIASAAVLASLLLTAPTAAQLNRSRISDKKDLIEEQCPGLSAEMSAVLTEHPVIDTHAHTFNLGYLPIQGLLYRSRFPRGLAEFLAGILEGMVDNSSLGTAGGRGESVGSANDIASQLSRKDRADLIAKKGAIYKAIRRAAEETGQPDSADPLGADLDENERARRILLDVSRTVGRDNHPGTTVQGSEEGWLRFFGMPLKREDYVARALADDHRLVDVFVYHMMDMEHVYATETAFDFDTQLRRVQRLDTLTEGVTRFTVAFDPFRGDDALSHVDKGIDAGAVAVKFYPPSGYRPSGNEIPKKPKFFMKKFPFVYLPVTARCEQRKQWASRYPQGRTEQAGADLDELVMKMFKKAHARSVPVFSHHTPVGFEASEDYGQKMAKPCFWKKVLDDSDLGNGTFRLVLGHSGGGDAWFEKEKWEGSFDQQAYNLCVYYPNVYCDLGYFSKILKKRGKEVFAKRLHQLIKEREENPERNAEAWTEDACETEKNAPPRYNIEDKILFGTDWYMVTKEKHQRKMVCAFAEALSSEPLPPEQQISIAKRFFGKNALAAFPRLQ